MAKTSTGGRLKAAVFLLVSLFAAALAALVIFMVIRNFQEQLQEVSAPPDFEQIVVAKRTLWPGETITEEDLETREFPPDFIPADVVLGTRELAINRVPIERILVNEFIRDERLARPEAGRGLPAIVPQGMRAISLDISGGSAVAGFLNPGNYVDVLVTAGDPVVTRTLFQAVTVLAVNDRLGAKIEVDEEGNRTGKKKKKQAPSVTVAVTPEMAEKLTHAHLEGVVTMTLRNDIDLKQEEETLGTDTASVLKIGQHREVLDPATGTTKKVQANARYKVKTIEEMRAAMSNDGTLIIIKGDEKTEQKVQVQ
jgi:pilus assembly protein CpaB